MQYSESIRLLHVCSASALAVCAQSWTAFLQSCRLKRPFKHSSIKRVLTAVLSCLSICSSICVAAPDEIQVYIDDMTEPGHFGADFYNNYVLSGSKIPDYPGAQSPYGVYRLTPEFYYGLSHSYELGLYVLSSLNPEGRTSLDGTKLRIKYIAPHDADEGSFWGANFELGRIVHRFAENPWNTELKGIYGYRTGS